MSSLQLFDAHTHVQFHAFKEDADLVIRRALDAGIWMTNVGTQRDTSQKAITIAENYPEGVYATVGLHPIHTEKSYHDVQELEELSPGHSEQSEESNEILHIAQDNTKNKSFFSREEEFDYEYYKKLAQ